MLRAAPVSRSASSFTPDISNVILGVSLLGRYVTCATSRGFASRRVSTDPLELRLIPLSFPAHHNGEHGNHTGNGYCDSL